MWQLEFGNAPSSESFVVPAWGQERQCYTWPPVRLIDKTWTLWKCCILLFSRRAIGNNNSMFMFDCHPQDTLCVCKYYKIPNHPKSTFGPRHLRCRPQSAVFTSFPWEDTCQIGSIWAYNHVQYIVSMFSLTSLVPSLECCWIQCMILIIRCRNISSLLKWSNPDSGRASQQNEIFLPISRVTSALCVVGFFIWKEV